MFKKQTQTLQNTKYKVKVSFLFNPPEITAFNSMVSALGDVFVSRVQYTCARMHARTHTIFKQKLNHTIYTGLQLFKKNMTLLHVFPCQNTHIYLILLNS